MNSHATFHSKRSRCAARFAAAALLFCASAFAHAQQAVTTVLADFESDSVAVSIGAVTNTSAADCSAARAGLPARGSQSLQVEIGSTQPNASIACDLVFRISTPFTTPNAAAMFAWVNEGEAWLAFRLRDAEGRVFETQPQTIQDGRRWVRIATDLSPGNLRRLTGAEQPAEPVQPVELAGVRVGTPRVGRQTVFLDDLEIEHTARPEETLRGEFQFDRQTHLYEPGATVRASLELENLSRESKLDLNLEYAWSRSDGTIAARGTAVVNLPAGGRDFRARQPMSLTQRLDQPGLYRLRVTARATRWREARTFDTSIAVMHSNRHLQRGRAIFFGVRSNLLREPLNDQLLEVQVAREIGAQLLVLEASWDRLEPRPGTFRFAPLDRVLQEASSRDLGVLIALVEPPAWLTAGGAMSIDTRQPLLIDALSRHAAARIVGVQAVSRSAAEPLSAEALANLRERAAALPNAPLILPPAESADANGAGPRLRQSQGNAAAAIAAGITAPPEEDAPIWWMHAGAAIPGSGETADAWSVLRAYLLAAQNGVATLAWSDLRDDTNDPRFAAQMNGLLGRDFSPKTSLLGYATAAGMLSGMRYVRAPLGLPPELEGWHFVGANRQVIALWPRATLPLPALVAPDSTTPGTITAVDFARRPLPLLRARAGLLAPVVAQPSFVAIEYNRIVTDPLLELRRPWLRCPAIALSGNDATFALEIDAPVALRSSFVQIVLPTDAPVTSSLNSRRISGAAGETVRLDAQFAPVAGRTFESVGATLRLSLEGQVYELPFEIRPLVAVPPLSPAFGAADSRTGGLRTPAAEAKDPGANVHVAYEAQRLHVAVALPPGDGQTLRIGAAAVGAESPTEVAIALSGDTAPPGWSVRRDRLGDADVLRIEIAASVLGVAKFEPGMRLLLAIQHEGGGAVRARWGGGLGGNGTPQEHNWLQLSPP